MNWVRGCNSVADKPWVRDCFGTQSFPFPASSYRMCYLGPRRVNSRKCAKSFRFLPIKSVNLQTLSKYHPKIARPKRKDQETRLPQATTCLMFPEKSAGKNFSHRCREPEAKIDDCRKLDNRGGG